MDQSTRSCFNILQLHLVHWNRSKYASPNEAAGQPDGLAVLGIMLSEKTTLGLTRVIRELLPAAQSNLDHGVDHGDPKQH